MCLQQRFSAGQIKAVKAFSILQACALVVAFLLLLRMLRKRTFWLFQIIQDPQRKGWKGVRVVGNPFMVFSVSILVHVRVVGLLMC